MTFSLPSPSPLLKLPKSNCEARSNYHGREVLEIVVSHLAPLSAPIYFTSPHNSPAGPCALWSNQSAKHQTQHTREIKHKRVKGKNSFYFLSRGHGNESCNLIGSKGGQDFPTSVCPARATVTAGKSW